MMIAKMNVEKYYPVVGITENMNMTLRVLEAKMPEYFEGGWDAYFNNEEVKKKRWKNNFKLPVSEVVNDRNGISPIPNRNRNTDFLPNRNRTETETQYRNFSVVNAWWLRQIPTNSIGILLI